MNDVSKEEFFNLIKLLKSPDKEIQKLGKITGITLGILIYGDDRYSFKYRNSYWFTLTNYSYCVIFTPNNTFTWTNPTEAVWPYIK